MEENAVAKPETETSTDEMNVKLDIEVNGHKEETEEAPAEEPVAVEDDDGAE